MQAIVAVYADWGIGAKGTQPLVIPADRKRFRELTAGAAVIVGRKTLEDFPGGRPLKNRHNIVITRQNLQIEGAKVAHTTDEAVTLSEQYDVCFVIGATACSGSFSPTSTPSTSRRSTPRRSPIPISRTSTRIPRGSALRQTPRRSTTA